MKRPIVVAVCSAKGSPGVTTLACALGAVWPAERAIVVAECDPSGGDIAARFGLSAKRGMTTLVVDARHAQSENPIDVQGHVQILPGGLEVLAGPIGAIASRTVDGELPNLLRMLLTGEMDLLLDLGRIQPGASGQVAALAAADQVLVVANRTVESVASTRWISQLLTRTEDILGSERPPEGEGRTVTKGTVSPNVGVVFVGAAYVPSEDAASALGLRRLGSVPVDRLGASAMRGEPVKPWRLERSGLIEAARSIVGAIFESHSEEQLAPDPPPGFRRSSTQSPISSEVSGSVSFSDSPTLSNGFLQLMADEATW